MGSFMVMGLFGLIIASVVNMFLQSSGLQWALSIVGIGIFAGLTAWDTQAIKENYFAGDGYEASEKKSIFGALKLYLDFINMFQMLLMLRRPPQLSQSEVTSPGRARRGPGFFSCSCRQTAATCRDWGAADERLRRRGRRACRR